VPVGANHTYPPAEAARLADPRVPIYLAQTWRAHPETLHATRARDRAAMAAASAIGRALRMHVS
jgi:hypothetical protein